MNFLQLTQSRINFFCSIHSYEWLSMLGRSIYLSVCDYDIEFLLSSKDGDKNIHTP
jgi:hypothetical protein